MIGKKRLLFTFIFFIFIGLYILFYLLNRTNITPFKSNIKCIDKYTNITKEQSYIFKNAQLRGLLSNPKGIEIYYIDKNKKESFFLVQLSTNFLKYIEKKAYLPKICHLKHNTIHTKYFKLSIPKEFDKDEKFYCFSHKGEYFILSKPNEKDYKNILISYIKVAKTK